MPDTSTGARVTHTASCPECGSRRMVCEVTESYALNGDGFTCDETFDRVAITGCADCRALIDIQASGAMPITNIKRNLGPDDVTRCSCCDTVAANA